jgi:hypothetical protein
MVDTVDKLMILCQLNQRRRVEISQELEFDITNYDKSSILAIIR